MSALNALLIPALAALMLVGWLVGCSVTSNNSGSGGGGPGATAAFQAICELSNGTSAIVCIDYPTDSTTNSSSCNTVEYSLYRSKLPKRD